METNKAFGQNLARIRKEKGLTQEGLMVRMGHNNRVQACDWEKGRKQPTLANIQKISEALGCSIEELLKPFENEKPDLKPIRFDHLSLQSILDGSKVSERVLFSNDEKIPFENGDILFVQETYSKHNDGIIYKLDIDNDEYGEVKKKVHGMKWVSAMCMTKLTARIFLKVKNARTHKKTYQGHELNILDFDFDLIERGDLD